MTTTTASWSRRLARGLPTAAPTNPEMTGTDLPLPQRESSGITAEHIEVLLDLALAAVPAPPLHETSRAAAYGWLREVQSGLWSRRKQLWMARRVIEAFHAEEASAAAVERTRRALHRSQEAAARRQWCSVEPGHGGPTGKPAVDPGGGWCWNTRIGTDVPADGLSLEVAPGRCVDVKGRPVRDKVEWLGDVVARATALAIWAVQALGTVRAIAGSGWFADRCRPRICRHFRALGKCWGILSAELP